MAGDLRQAGIRPVRPSASRSLLVALAVLVLSGCSTAGQSDLNNVLRDINQTLAPLVIFKAAGAP